MQDSRPIRVAQVRSDRSFKAILTRNKPATIVLTGSLVLAVFLGIRTGPAQLMNTFVTGGMWALLAIGLALVFGVMNIAHFAHGESFMVGAFIGYFVFIPLQRALKANPNELLSMLAPFVGMIVAVIAGFVLGLVLERLIFYPLRRNTKSGATTDTRSAPKRKSERGVILACTKGSASATRPCWS